MISRRKILACAAIGVIGSANQAFAKSSKPSAVERFDTDHDSTVDLAEAKKAATETFNKLDADKDGTLDLKELGGRVSRKELAAADFSARVSTSCWNLNTDYATKGRVYLWHCRCTGRYLPWIQIRPDNGQKEASKKNSARRMVERR